MVSHLSALARGGPIGVDRESNSILGYVVAETGEFKSGRGSFDRDSLKEIVSLMSTQAVPSRLGHRSFMDDAPGRFLGRVSNARLDGPDKVRADLRLSKAAFVAPEGDLGTYVLELADEDKGALSSSLVLTANEEFDVDKQGRATGPPIWRPTAILGSDIVEEGDAVGDLLSTCDESTCRRQLSVWVKAFCQGKTRPRALQELRRHIDDVMKTQYGEPVNLAPYLKEMQDVGMKV